MAEKRKPMPTIGVDKYTFFELTKDDATGVEYGTPYHLRGTVKISPTDSGASDPFDADNGEYAADNYIDNMGHEIENADIPPEVDAMWRGLEQKNGLVEVGGDAKTVYFGVAWRILKKTEDKNNKYRYVRYYKGSYSFASNVGGETKPSRGASNKQTAQATYTAVQRDYDDNYYAYFDEADIPEGITRAEFEEKWFTDLNFYPAAASVTPTASTTSKKASSATV